jgi:inner membrane protein YidH
MKTQIPLIEEGPTGLESPASSTKTTRIGAEELALDRTRMASERTLMAWVRTALSMIAFGFTIYKFLQVMQQQSTVPVLRPQAPRNVGLMLVGMGTLAVVVACAQHWIYVKKLRPERPYKPWDLAFVMGILIGLLGLLIFASILRTAGPFG